MSVVTVQKDRYTVDPLYQWDLNQVLEISGLSLPSVPEIHFTNETMDRAIVKQAAMDGAGVITVDVPNSLLQKPYKIKAYVCVHEGDTFETLYLIEVPVKARKKPNDYTLEDDLEVYSFNALENLVNNAVVTLTAKYDETQTIATDAITIANGKNRAHVFNTTDDFYAWLSNPQNAGLYQVGDNIYIVDTDVPDWWISDVLTQPDTTTGFYYKIAQLETQKVDLTEINEELTNLNNRIDSSYKIGRQIIGKTTGGENIYRQISELSLGPGFQESDSFKSNQLFLNTPFTTLYSISAHISSISGTERYFLPYYANGGELRTYLGAITDEYIRIENKANWFNYNLVVEIVYS